MTAGDLSFENERLLLLPTGAKAARPDAGSCPGRPLDALRAALAAYGRELEHMSPHESLWPSPAATNGEGLRSATFYGRFRRYLEKAGLPPAGLHILRHTRGQAAPGRRGEHRGRVPVPGSQLARGDHHLPAPAGRAGGPGLGQGGGGDRGVNLLRSRLLPRRSGVIQVSSASILPWHRSKPPPELWPPPCPVVSNPTGVRHHRPPNAASILSLFSLPADPLSAPALLATSDAHVAIARCGDGRGDGARLLIGLFSARSSGHSFQPSGVSTLLGCDAYASVKGGDYPHGSSRTGRSTCELSAQ